MNQLFLTAEPLGNAKFKYQYSIAGFVLYSQTKVSLIEAFEVFYDANAVNEALCEKLLAKLPDVNNPLFDTVYQGQGAFSGGFKQVKIDYLVDSQKLSLNSKEFSLSNLTNGHIHLLGNNRADDLVVAEVLLGPPLLCNLAAKNVFCFHAGAVSTLHGSAIFIGESGRGKSTLSEEAVEQSWQRLGDDIMPVYLEKTVCKLLPRFPQLKRTNQHLDDTDINLTAIFRLAEPKQGDEVRFQNVTGYECILTLSRHIASSLAFSPSLLELKMQFVSALVKRVPIFDLSYQRNLSQLGELRKKIDEKLLLIE